MQTVEVQAKTLDEAKKLAAEKLSVDEAQLGVTILEEVKGLFGKSNVRIKAEVVEAKPAKEKAARKPAASKKVATKAEPEVVEEKPEDKEPAKPKRATKAKADAKPSASEETSESSDEVVEVVASKKDADTLVGLVNEILKLSELNASVEHKSLNGRYVNLDLDGSDVAFLVGKHGEVLNNFQYLINVIANKQLNNGVRVTLDGNDYRERREAALTKQANDIATQVRDRGEEAVLDALPAFERRVVHNALAEMDGITTYSEGEEPNRRVVIAPK